MFLRLTNQFQPPHPKKAENEKVASGFFTQIHFTMTCSASACRYRKMGNLLQLSHVQQKRDFKNLFNAPSDFTQKYLINQGPALV